MFKAYEVPIEFPKYSLGNLVLKYLQFYSSRKYLNKQLKGGHHVKRNSNKK